MSELVEWLRGVLDEDERRLNVSRIHQRIRDEYLERWRYADIAAKRAALDLVDKAREWTEGTPGATAGYAHAIITDVVRRLAEAYADRPGYRQEWRP